MIKIDLILAKKLNQLNGQIIFNDRKYFFMIDDL